MKKILILENEHDYIFDFLKISLNDLNLVIILNRDINNVIDVINKENPDIIIIDYHIENALFGPIKLINELLNLKKESMKIIISLCCDCYKEDHNMQGLIDKNKGIILSNSFISTRDKIVELYNRQKPA